MAAISSDANNSGLSGQFTRDVSLLSESTLRETTGGPEELLSRTISHEPFSADIDMPDAASPYNEGLTGQYIVSIDFGTTFSTVAFVKLPSEQKENLVHLDKIRTIVNFPDEIMTDGTTRPEVPTESWYPNKATYRDSADFNDSNALDEELIEDFCDENDLSTATDICDIDEDEDTDHESQEAYFWGYGVQRQFRFPDANLNQDRRIARSKLILAESEHTAQVRNELFPILNRLKRKKIIKHNFDVISDFLIEVFKHTKKQLELHYDFNESCAVEFVLCVPAIWTQKASRIMQTAMETAIRSSRFGLLENGGVNNLFIVSEPEAASAYVLEEENVVKAGETFVLLDAGGGTVDAITYTVDKNYPLRLKKEAVTPGGALCGSSYLNEGFKKHMMSRLAEERYLEVDGLTIESIVDREMVEFENRTKRTVNIMRTDFPTDAIYIQGLRNNPEKRFKANRFLLMRTDFLSVFMPLLRGVGHLMAEQLHRAREKGLDISLIASQKVILIGGFASSPSLRTYLNKEVQRISKSWEKNIRLIIPKTPGTAVAVGAVLRALNKSNGPARVSLSSYGFLRTEPHEPECIEAHREVKRPTFDPLDGRHYVKNTIDWLVKKGQTIPPLMEYKIDVIHTFSTRNFERFLCEELLFVSDSSTESHYRRGDPRNSTAEVAGRIIVDMTFLRTDGLISPIEPEAGDRGKRHYKVEYELVMIVDGRNMRYEARYPAGGHVHGRGQISIAAAFEHGTN